MKFAQLVLVLLVASSIAFIAIPATASEIYTKQELEVSSGFYGDNLFSINDSGTVLGPNVIGSNNPFATFIWSQQSGTADLSNQCIVVNAGINKAGQTVGVYEGPSTNYLTRPYIRNADGSSTILQIQGVSSVWPSALNNLGQVAAELGYMDTNGYYTKTGTALIDGSGAISEIDLPDTNYSVSDLSDTGYIAINGDGKAYSWFSGIGLTELQGLNSTDITRSQSVNNHGFVAGTSGDHAVMWRPDGGIVDLGLGVAYGINNLGQVVGQSNNKAVLWNLNGSIVNLGLDENTWATAINDKGWIVGGSMSPTYQSFLTTVLWEPIVPEPSSLLTLAGGLLSLGGVVLKRRAKVLQA